MKKACHSLYDFAAGASDQLLINAGEQLILLDENLDGGWSRVKNKEGFSGKVPTSYIEISNHSKRLL